MVDSLQKHKSTLVWFAGGIVLVTVHAFLAWLSGEFRPDTELAQRPILTLVALLLLAGVVFLFVVWKAGDAPASKGLLLWVVVVGIALRCLMLFSTPALEDDYNRYLWDGAVLAHGFNPYAYAPKEIASAPDVIPPALRDLAVEGKKVLHRINYPHLRTIYPPIAQAAFAAAYMLKPWSLMAWRTVILLADLAVLALLLAALQGLNLSPLLVAIYWWNPLVLKEAFNSAHMDVLLIPLTLTALLLSVRHRYLLSAGALALAAGLKLWPVVLLPVIVAPLFRAPKRLILPAGLFFLLCAVMALPVYLTGLEARSGFTAYGRSWEMNDSLYLLFLWAAQFTVRVVGWEIGSAQIITRLMVGLILICWIAWLSRDPVDDPRTLWHPALAIVAALFLLSPTQFPWYYLWVVQFLVIAPRPSLLVLNVLLMLYYLRFYFNAHGRAGLFDNWMVWIEFGPVWVLLVWEWVKAGGGKKFLGLELMPTQRSSG